MCIGVGPVPLRGTCMEGLERGAALASHGANGVARRLGVVNQLVSSCFYAGGVLTSRPSSDRGESLCLAQAVR